MKPPFSRFLGFLAAVLVSTGTLLARDGGATPAAPPPNPVEIGLGGLQTSLTTGGFHFVIGDTAKAGVTSLDAFPATASLQNRSPFDIKFTFPTPAAAELKFTFRVFDSAGAKVWESDADMVAPQVVTDATLGKFQRWKRTLAIPLKPGGKALVAGLYTLEASIDADKQVGASAVFEVVAGTPPPDPDKTGINGLVLKADSAPVDGQPAPAETPAAGALVVVNEIVSTNTPPTRPPFNWSGKTDDAGKFTAYAPAGHYRVTANYVSPAAAAGGPAPLVYPPKTIEVTVVDQHFVDATIHLVPLPAPPPPTTQGIKGHVFISLPANSPTAPGVEVPLAGAAVTIDQVTDAVGAVPFHWQGTAGLDGGFAAGTPVGHFKITAAAAANGTNANPPAPVTVETDVVAGHIAEVALHLVTPPPPTTTQGIKGLVLITNTATGPNAPAEVPLFGALVKIDQVVEAGATAFHWTGVAGLEGRFTVPTPAGHFKVTAAVPGTPTGAQTNATTVPPVTVEVTVVAGAFAEVVVHLKPVTVATR